MSGFRHIVVLDLDEGCDVDALLDALRRLPDTIGELRSYVVGRDAGVNQGNATVGVVADFDDVDGYLVYRDHPDHVRVITERITPHLRGRSAVQHTT